jgi:hypothetical protein
MHHTKSIKAAHIAIPKTSCDWNSSGWPRISHMTEGNQEEYHGGLTLILKNNCCLVEGCLHEFETTEDNQKFYPHISPVCCCTVCRSCIDGRAELEREKRNWKGYSVLCPACLTDNAFNLRKLVPNRSLANVLAETRRLLENGNKWHDNSKRTGEPIVPYGTSGSKKRKGEH